MWFAILGFRPVDDTLRGIPLVDMQGSNFFHPLSGKHEILLQNSTLFPGGFACEFGRWLVPLPIEGVAASTLWYKRLTLGWASHECWRSTAEELGEPPQVLRGCGEQHLVARTA